MSADHSTDASSVNALIPTRLSDIIRAHHDQVSIYLATERQMTEITVVIGASEAVRETVTQWYLVVTQVHVPERNHYTMALLGYVGSKPWITSTVVAIDRQLGRVRTANSLYAIDLATPGEGEPDALLLGVICARLNETRVGAYLGVPPWYF